MVDGKNVVSFSNTLFAHVTCFGPFGILDIIEWSLSDQGLGVFCTLSSILLNLFLPGHLLISEDVCTVLVCARYT